MNRCRTSSRGQALVEFGLILPIFLLVLFGLFDLGRAVFAYNTIQNAAREAVRVAIVDQNEDVILAEAQAHAIGLGLSDADVTLSFLEPESLAAPCNTPIAISCEVEILVNYTFTPATPIIGNLVGNLNLSAASRQPVERSYVSP
ncbi:TadE/TadG family type IV pilus assembly protein [Mycobacterium sp.]|uniref:TadE/TadG family type IV pilus assembly protein n=1 Tax=Mycobacterium sp. TaxID=1785 RepID=UPI002D865470|nr:TadE/TadG family type IV pilus assembly protein [Mycobacterium sp.]